MTWNQAQQLVNAINTCIACSKPAPYVRQVGSDKFGVCAEHFGIGLTEPVPQQITIHAVCGHCYTITDTNADEIADLKTQMCPGCIEEMIAFEQACEEEYQASMDDEPLRNERGDRLE